MTERFITSTLNRRDAAKEVTLRPPSFSEFPGQERVKEQLELFVQAAKARGEALDHILLSDLRDWEKPPLPTSSPMNGEPISKVPAVPLSKNRAILPDFLQVWNPVMFFSLTRSTA